MKLAQQYNHMVKFPTFKQKETRTRKDEQGAPVMQLVIVWYLHKKMDSFAGQQQISEALTNHTDYPTVPQNICITSKVSVNTDMYFTCLVET